ncbi:MULTISPECIES: DUF4258 domain-containing protein [Allobacillus]|nr:DUF4258 domain-containing protein [Allobacillus salarius]
MQEYWEDEMQGLRETVRLNENITFSNHAAKDRMVERNITLEDLGMAMLTGAIYEGYNIGEYPHKFNKDPFRTVVGRDFNGELISIGVALKGKRSFEVTTIYKGVTDRLKYFFK